VEIVLTFEGMWVIVGALDLDGGMIEFVLAAAEIGDGIQGFKRLRRNDMAAERKFA
jgi:hypothetical protein